ncbi:DUF1178 family protein [Comamonadaceae bacterium PP-2]
MKVLDLQCAHQHVFEGWFGSEDDYRSQLARGLLTCPVCGDAAIQRLISAPRLNRKSNALPAAVQPPASGTSAARSAAQPVVPQARVPADTAPPSETQVALQAAYLEAVRHVLRNTEDVGPRFAEEARRMHYGESEAHGIRGQASPQERQALAEEGIDVVSLPLPEGLDGTLQ